MENKIKIETGVHKKLYTVALKAMQTNIKIGSNRIYPCEVGSNKERCFKYLRDVIKNP
jgi:hypothetical protein